MHIGALGFVSTEGWLDADGKLETERLRTLLAERARGVPGLERTLSRAPLTRWPVWLSHQRTDWDAQIEIAESASTEPEVRSIADAAMAEPLDRTRPLWRILIIPGPAGAEQFGILFLAHHALVDGIAGIDLLALLLDRSEAARPAPSLPGLKQSDMLANEVLRWANVPQHLAKSAVAVLQKPRYRARIARRTMALVRTIVRLLSPGPRTLLKGANEKSRGVSWFSVEDRPLRMARQRLGGTPNDLVLAAVATAIHELPGNHNRLQFRKIRAAVPVSFRTRSERYSLGNRLGLQLLPLDPRNGNLARAVTGIHRESVLQKQRGDAEGYEVLSELTGWTGQWSQRLLNWIAGKAHSYAILITSVPGPSKSYTLGGAEVQQIFPLVPLFGSQSLSVAVVRYGGQLRIGMTSSWEDPKMLELFTENLRLAFDRITRTPAEPVPAAVPGGTALPLPRIS